MSLHPAPRIPNSQYIHYFIWQFAQRQRTGTHQFRWPLWSPAALGEAGIEAQPADRHRAQRLRGSIPHPGVAAGREQDQGDIEQDVPGTAPTKNAVSPFKCLWDC